MCIVYFERSSHGFQVWCKWQMKNYRPRKYRREIAPNKTVFWEVGKAVEYAESYARSIRICKKITCLVDYNSLHESNTKCL